MPLLAFGNINSRKLHPDNSMHGLGPPVYRLLPHCSLGIRDRFHSARRRSPAQSPSHAGNDSRQIVALLIPPQFVSYYEFSIRLRPLRCA